MAKCTNVSEFDRSHNQHLSKVFQGHFVFSVAVNADPGPKLGPWRPWRPSHTGLEAGFPDACGLSQQDQHPDTKPTCFRDGWRRRVPPRDPDLRVRALWQSTGAQTPMLRSLPVSVCVVGRLLSNMFIK